MKELNLNYLNIPQEHKIVEILRNYGGQLSTKTNGFISYLTTSGYSLENDFQSASLYIVAPEINRQHRLISVDLENAQNLKIIIWGLSNQTDYHSAKIDINYSDFDNKIWELLSSPIAKSIIKLFVDQTILKFELRKEK
ncbi:MAG: hypothetical protein RBT49_00845 [Bacteroidales bacterium]|jgi:hypothetical protein|nr:hypothetical protein [Bacteroidales bacterium]